MYLLGYCDHYVELKKKNRHLFDGYGETWSLKEYGTLFVYDHIIENDRCQLLEFGPGYNVFFTDKLAGNAKISYTGMDEPNDELGISKDEGRFAKAVAARKANGHNHETCLLGVGSGHLPDSSYDCIFSISVVEHIDIQDMVTVAKEAARLLKPGGVLVNSIDIYHKSIKDRHWHAACREVELQVPVPHHHGDWDFSGSWTTFLEKQRVRYEIYNSLSFNNIVEPPPYASQFATVLHAAHKLPDQATQL